MSYYVKLIVADQTCETTLPLTHQHTHSPEKELLMRYVAELHSNALSQYNHIINDKQEISPLPFLKTGTDRRAVGQSWVGAI